MKKLFALLLIVAMVFSTVAIAESKPITWSGTISVASYMFGPYDETQDVCIKWTEDMIRERYGLDVKFDIVYIENSNYDEIINTRLAGGTAPDMFIGHGDARTRELLDQGAIRTFDVDFFKTNAPDVYNYIVNGGYQGRLASSVDLWWEYAMAGDQMVTIPKLDEQNAMPSKSLIYRKDWLDKLGVTEDQLPKTLDDFVALLYRFKNEDPDGNGQNDTFGCSTSTVITIFGAYGSSYNSQMWLDRDGKLVSTDVLPENKAALELCAKLYADGVLAPTFVAENGENEGGYWAIPHGFINGVFGVTAHASIDHFRRKGVVGDTDEGGPVMTEYYAVNGEDADVVYGPWPMGPDGEYGLSVGSAANTGENMVYNASIDDDKLAAIFQIMNIFATDDEIYMRAAYGIEGVHYQITDQNTLEVLDYENNTDSKSGIGLFVLRGMWGAEKAYSDCSNWYSFYGDVSIKNRLDNFDKDQCASYRVNKLTATLPSQSEIYVDLETLRKEAFVEIITGVQPIDYYDEYVEEYMALGGQTLADEANEWYTSK